jgi:hypothetical protein
MKQVVIGLTDRSTIQSPPPPRRLQPDIDADALGLMEGGNIDSTYLNRPPVTKAKKINAAAKSNPAIIFFLRATLR